MLAHFGWPPNSSDSKSPGIQCTPPMRIPKYTNTQVLNSAMHKMPLEKMNTNFTYLFIYFLFCFVFETGILCVALAVLKLDL